MTSNFNPYVEWLGIDAAKTPPNHYELLRLESTVQDSHVVAKAAERAASRVRSHRPGEHLAEWAALLDEIATAKQCLTDDKARHKYDASIGLPPVKPTRRGIHSSKSASENAVTSASDIAPELAAAMAPLPIPPSIPEDVSASTPPLIDPMAPLALSPNAYAPPEPAPPAPQLSPAHEGIPTEGISTESIPVSVSPRFLQKRKRQSMAVPLTVTVVCLVILAAGAFGVQQLLQTRADRQTEVANLDSQSQRPAPPDRSRSTGPDYRADHASQSPEEKNNGAPSPLKSDASGSLPPAVSDNAPNAESRSGTEAPSAQPPQESGPATTPTDTATIKNSDASMVMSIPSKPEMPESDAPEPEEPPPSPADLARLGLALRKAKSSIGTREFDLANEFLNIAEKLVHSPEQLAKLERLRLLSRLTERYQEAIVTSVAKLEPGASFDIGETSVVVVETSRDELVVRAGAQNRDFLLYELPLRLAYVLAEQTLAEQDPNTRTLKAAYTVSHPKSTPEDMASARESLSQVAESVEDAKALLPIFEDVYEFDQASRE